MEERRRKFRQSSYKNLLAQAATIDKTLLMERPQIKSKTESKQTQIKKPFNARLGSTQSTDMLKLGNNIGRKETSHTLNSTNDKKYTGDAKGISALRKDQNGPSSKGSKSVLQERSSRPIDGTRLKNETSSKIKVAGRPEKNFGSTRNPSSGSLPSRNAVNSQRKMLANKGNRTMVTKRYKDKEEEEEEEEESEDSFIDDDEDEEEVKTKVRETDHRSLIHQIMGYDPKKYMKNDVYSDEDDMEASMTQINREDRLAEKHARDEDEKELNAELRHKEEKRRRLMKKNKTTK